MKKNSQKMNDASEHKMKKISLYFSIYFLTFNINLLVLISFFYLVIKHILKVKNNPKMFSTLVFLCRLFKREREL